MPRRLDEDQHQERPEPKGLLWWLFFMPGAVVLWLEYMFPGRGQVYASGRRRGSKVVQFLYTLGVYAITGFILIAVLAPSGNRSQHVTSTAPDVRGPPAPTSPQMPARSYPEPPAPRAMPEPAMPWDAKRPSDTSPPAPVVQPSFDCRLAKTGLEMAICAAPELARLDVLMNDVFQSRMAALNAEGRKAFQQQQIKWLQNRAAGCRLAVTASMEQWMVRENRICAAKAMAARIDELG